MKIIVIKIQDACVSLNNKKKVLCIGILISIIEINNKYK